MVVYENAADDAVGLRKRAERAAEKKIAETGGVLTQNQLNDAVPDQDTLLETAFQKLWESNASWITTVLRDAVNFAQRNPARVQSVLEQPQHDTEISRLFYSKLWPALKSRGWKEEALGHHKHFIFDNQRVSILASSQVPVIFGLLISFDVYLSSLCRRSRC